MPVPSPMRERRTCLLSCQYCVGPGRGQADSRDICTAAGRLCRLAYCVSVACGGPEAGIMLSLVMSTAASGRW